MEQTTSAAYPNIMVVDYVNKARVANPKLLEKAEQYLSAGYQRLLTFEHSQGGFGWYCHAPPQVWLSAYALQALSDMNKVHPIDGAVTERTQKWLLAQRDKDGTWSNIGDAHGRLVSRVGNAKFVLTSYVTWALLESGMPERELAPAIKYIRSQLDDGSHSTYALALAANALVAFDWQDDSVSTVVQMLQARAKDHPQHRSVCYPAQGESLTHARGDSATIETTALVAIALSKTDLFPARLNSALQFLVKSKQAGGTWGSTSATVLSLKALTAGMSGAQLKQPVPFSILVDGRSVAQGKIAPDNADVMQTFELGQHLRRLPKSPRLRKSQQIVLQVRGETPSTFQIISRHFEPWPKQAHAGKQALELDIAYDRTRLAPGEKVNARAVLRYNGKTATNMVMVELGLPPGFEMDAKDFTRLVENKQVEKFETAPGRVILYLGTTQPGDEKTFRYALTAKQPARVQTPPSRAYEYYTPANRTITRPVSLTVAAKE